MGSFEIWLEVLSLTKALFEATTLGADLYKSYDAHRKEHDTIAEARRVSKTDSTYSPKAVEAILKRLEACRDRFVLEGSGPSRKQCLCSVFRDAMEGNGGELPQIDDWQNMLQKLNCRRESFAVWQTSHQLSTEHQ
ncbi:MAG TPA: hypothetical protein VHB45_13925 [Alloacidobacterium sp.]|nr:hypothetical protein [Alloacidobacterium sp.]